MSYREWIPSNGMGRLRIHSDDDLCRFDKLSGSMIFRLRNVMIEYEDYRTNQRTIIIAEKCFLWEVENNVYIQTVGRRVVYTEPIYPERRNTISKKNRKATEVYTYPSTVPLG